MESQKVSTNPCSMMHCPSSYRCEIYKPTGDVFCNPDCNQNNGGCPDDETCILQQVQCIRAPCPPIVRCFKSHIWRIDHRAVSQFIKNTSSSLNVLVIVRWIHMVWSVIIVLRLRVLCDQVYLLAGSAQAKISNSYCWLYHNNIIIVEPSNIQYQYHVD